MNTFQCLATRRGKNRSGVLTASLSTALITAMLITLALTTRAQLTFTPILNISAAQQAGAAQESTPSQLTISFSNEDLSPANATVIAGKVLLKVEDQRPQERRTLRINRQSGELVREITLPDKATEWNTELELGVGQYVLSETSRTGGSCVITAQSPPTN